ncbi:Kinesin-like protein KIF13B [Nosema bombycis CQ1]|uniref:Kinesin-like protein KIF13B n=1 Tax=Nosema bombycis (strain CQ1 / CVCC 102059) TaxID=578461 RepID=R0KN38_NOSB1|nr:Kinesin-like protein KIF13B [Nosema bombycis CQ1]|eukprot:EOB12071.1 Kinesin-like protein KIF13B [Nosema bombycis CQ1]
MTRIGDKIQMKQGIEATVKYIGPIDNKEGQWIGLELSKEIGKNNGFIYGKKYYECKEGCGLLVRYERFLGFISKNSTSGNDLTVDSPLRDNSILFKDCTIKVEDLKQNKTNFDTPNEDKNDVKGIIKQNIYLSEINKYTKQVEA